MRPLPAPTQPPHWFYYFGKFLTRVLLHLLTRWEVFGQENVPTSGPVLVVANHLSLADPPSLSVTLGRRAVFMAKEELFRPVFTGYFIKNFGAFPVRRGSLDRRALCLAREYLQRGCALVMFPEGRRSRTCHLQPAQPGSALIASGMTVPVLPVGITGTEAMRGAFWWLRRPRITFNIGRPFSLSANSEKPTKAELARQSAVITEHIAELLPTKYGGKMA